MKGAAERRGVVLMQTLILVFVILLTATALLWWAFSDHVVVQRLGQRASDRHVAEGVYAKINACWRRQDRPRCSATVCDNTASLPPCDFSTTFDGIPVDVRLDLAGSDVTMRIKVGKPSRP
ncbi:MAG: hypothetical protein HY554_12555 [Elusimicrobia bacterium]|nr:hypothetical protein [Elusimicrobiota bacterium]